MFAALVVLCLLDQPLAARPILEDECSLLQLHSATNERSKILPKNFKSILPKPDAKLAKKFAAKKAAAKKARPMAAKGKPVDIHFLRIQKTGGSTFGEHILPHFCKAYTKKNCRGILHEDWNIVEKAPRIVTLLRDPVERTMSEFHFLKHAKWAFDQSQWDYGSVPKTAAQSLWKDIKDRNITSWLNSTMNPSVNRQTLYLAGFKPPKRIPSLSTGEKVLLTKGIDWKKDGPELFERAKQHLASNKVVFGLADDYECSMKLFSNVFGWPADKVIARTRKLHVHRQNKTKLAFTLGFPDGLKCGTEFLQGKGHSYRGCQTKTRTGRLCQAWSSQTPQKHRNTPEKKPKSGLVGNYCRNPDKSKTIWCYTVDKKKRWELCEPTTSSPYPTNFLKWSDGINDEVKHEITTANAFDVQLFEYAKALFKFRTKGIC